MRVVLLQLLVPVLLLTFVLGSAEAALITGQVTTAVRLGATLACAARFATWLPLWTVPGSIVAGAGVDKEGDARALVGSGSVANFAVLSLVEY